MDYGSVGIDFNKVTEDSKPSYEVEIYASSTCMTTEIGMSRDDLKQFRNMVHNLLLELNQELNWEN